MNTLPTAAPAGPGDPGLSALARSIDQEGAAIATAASSAPAAPGAAPAGAAPAAAAPGAPVAIDWTREARDFWKIIAMLSRRFPRLKPVFSPENIESLSLGWAPVIERHGLHAGILGIYLGAGLVSLPIAFDAYDAIRADLKDEKAEDARAAAGAGQVNVAAPPGAPAAAAGAAHTAGAQIGASAPPDALQLHQRA